MIRKKELRKYYKTIRKKLYCPFNMKHILMSEFSNRVLDFLESNQDADINTIINYFGTPDEIVRNFDINNVSLKNKVKKRIIIERILFIIILVIIIVSSFIISKIIIDMGGTKIITN